MTTILVTSATGTVGGTVARLALSKGWNVHAVVRNQDSPASKALADLGVVLFTGDYDNKEAIAAALKGCTALFLNLAVNFVDLTAEIRWATSFLSLAKAAGVTSVVSSTVGGSRELSQSPTTKPSVFKSMLENKEKVDLLVQKSGIPNWTCLQPTNFMANYLTPKVHMMCPQLLKDGTWTTAMQPDTQIPMVDDLDIAKFATAAIAEPARFNGHSIVLGSEFLTPRGIMDALGKAAGRTFDIRYLTDEEIEEQRSTNMFIEGSYAMRNLGMVLDLEKVRHYGIDISTFEQYLEREKEVVKQTFSI